MSVLIGLTGLAVYVKDVSNLDEKLNGLISLGCITDYKCYYLELDEIHDIERYFMYRDGLYMYTSDPLLFPKRILERYGNFDKLIDINSFGSLMSQAVEFIFSD